jgi:hypothetical protein
MDAVALGRSDSGGQRTSLGRGERGRIGEAAGARNVGAAADKWEAMTRDPVGSGWVWEGEAAWHDADTRSRQHSAGWREFKWDSNNFKWIQICPKL